jgi:hypothetical protein
LGFRVWGLGFGGVRNLRVRGSEFGVWSFKFELDSGFGVWGWGLGLGALGLGYGIVILFSFFGGFGVRGFRV